MSKLPLVVVLLLVFLCATHKGNAARILGIFPLPGISHNILTSKLMRGLVVAGHDVTMVSAYPMKNLPKGANYTDIVLDDFTAIMNDNSQRPDMFNMNKGGMVSMLFTLTDFMLQITNRTLYHPKVLALLDSNQQFDAVVLEQFSNDALKVFAHHYNCPLIILSSIGPNSWVNTLVGNPQPVSYASHIMKGDFSNDLSFYNRFTNLFAYISDFLISELYVLPGQEKAMKQAFPNAPPLKELRSNVSLVLLNSDSSLYPALPLVPNMVEIGGYFIDPPQKLPDDLQKFLDDSKEGVIYFSMGSNLKSKDLPPERRKMLLNVLGKLKQKVLWKFEAELPDKPKNVEIRSWLPQQDILAHPNIKLFITHGGLLSISETIYHGVPVLSIPVFGDQMANADRAEQAGYGLKLSYHDPNFTEETFSQYINELLDNPKYRENAQRKSELFHDKPMKPMDNAVFWVNYVIRHKGAPHLRVAGVRLPWYKYHMVDVFGAIALAIYIVIKLIVLLFRRLFSKGRTVAEREGEKQKTN